MSAKSEEKLTFCHFRYEKIDFMPNISKTVMDMILDSERVR